MCDRNATILRVKTKIGTRRWVFGQEEVLYFVFVGLKNLLGLLRNPTLLCFISYFMREETLQIYSVKGSMRMIMKTSRAFLMGNSVVACTAH